MNILFPRHLRTVLVAAALVLPAAAQNARIQIHSLEKLAAQATEVVDVTLEGPVLKMAAKFMGSDPEARQLVQGLTGVFVRSFEFDKPGAYTRADVEGIRAQLQGPGWARIVSVRDKKALDQVEVYIMADAAGNPQGLVVLAAEAKELTVVNIVGSIDLDRLSALEGKLGIPKVNLQKQGPAHEAKP